MIALGIDAGGSSTKWAVVDGSGTALAAGRVAPLSGHLYHRDSRDRAENVLEELCAQVVSFAPRVALAGVTGLTRGSSNAAWLEDLILQSLTVERCEVVGDMDLAYRAHYQPGAGIVLCAGTGSIAYHVTKTQEVKRAGGRGYMIDDVGGGYWIGQRALRFTVRQMDAGLPMNDPLSSALLAQIGASDWDAIRAYVYVGDRSAVSMLAPLVGVAAEQGSVEAQRILETAGRELTAVVQRLQAQIGILPITTVGGAWLISPRIADAARATGLAFTASRMDLSIAAARLALELNSGS